MNVLVVDVGGTHVKILATGQRARREFESGPALTPKRMVARVRKLAAGWKYDVVSIGYPGPVLHGRPVAEPHNLGRGLRGLKRLGKKRWRRAVEDVVARLVAALEPDDVILGGGNVEKLKQLPEGCRAGANENAFLGGFRLWEPGGEAAARRRRGGRRTSQV